MGCIHGSHRFGVLSGQSWEESHHMLPSGIEEVSSISVVQVKAVTTNPLTSELPNDILVTYYISPEIHTLETTAVSHEEHPRGGKYSLNPFTFVTNRHTQRVRSRSFSAYEESESEGFEYNSHFKSILGKEY